MNAVGESKKPMPITVTRKLKLRPDGEYTRVTITQGDTEINLTPEQAHSLAVALQVYIKHSDIGEKK